MANSCYTDYVFEGNSKKLIDFNNTLAKLSVRERISFHDLVEHYKIDKPLDLRGEIFYFEYDNSNNTLTFSTESAWTACHDIFKEINKIYDNEFRISYREIESGYEIFNVHDEGEWFNEDVVVNCCLGDEEIYDIPMFVDDALNLYCSLTHYRNYDLTNDENIDFINKQKYENDEDFFQIHRINFI